MRKIVYIFLLFFFADCKKASLHFPENTRPYRIAENFQLTDQLGKSINFYENTTGKKITILFFGYAHCPDICISVLQKLSKTYDMLDEKEKDQVQFLFISIDPSRDNFIKLKEYSKQFNKNIIFLTGDLNEIQNIKTRFKIIAEKNESQTDSKKKSELIHSTNLLWINSDKEIIRSLPHQFRQIDLLEEIQYFLIQD